MNACRLPIILLLWIAFAPSVTAQQVNETTILSELEKRGYDPNRVKQELLIRGFDESAFTSADPVVIGNLKKAASDIVKVLDEEKKASAQEVKDSDNIISPKETGNMTPGKGAATGFQDAVSQSEKKENTNSQNKQERTGAEQQEVLTYGQHIFRDKSLVLFRTSADAKAARNYVLGQGDKVSISIWGPTQENFTLEIQKDGYIQPTGLKRFYLAGLTVDQAKELMYAGLRGKYFFEKENFDVSIATARTVNVNIVGEVVQNGTYNISAVNTAFNALVAAGGPNEIGSVRKIQLLRAGSKPKTLDVYRFLQDPISSYEFYLSENDYIHVPVAEKIVTVLGAVNRPFRYELLPNEQLAEVLAFAGGLKPGALKKIIRVKRMEGDSIRILDVDLAALEESKKNFPLFHGDIIEVREMEDMIKNQVLISGGVETPGVYALTTDTRFSDVLGKAKLTQNAVTDFAYLFRKGAVNAKMTDYLQINLRQVIKNPGSDWDVLLQPGDSIAIYVGDQFTDETFIKIEGAVRNPGQFRFSPSLRLKDLLLLAGGVKREAALDRIDVYRLQLEANKTTRVLAARLTLDEKYDVAGSMGEYHLQPFDQVFVRSAPEFELQRNISVLGEVKYPGTYALLNENMRMDALIRESGGATDEAFLRGATLARGMDNIGYVIIDLEAALANPGSHENIILQDGDVITIPKISNIVTITGATKSQELYPEKITSQNKIQVSYRKGKHARYYIDQFAGGLSKDASVGRIAVIDASGKVTKVRNYLLFRKYPEVGPGAEIRVGYKEKKLKNDGGKEKKEIKWGEILSNAITQATAVLSLILLIQNVK